MGKKYWNKSSTVRNKSGKVVGKDTTYHRPDGSSKTVHQKASSNVFGGVSATRITGVTQNRGGRSRN